MSGVGEWYEKAGKLSQLDFLHQYDMYQVSEQIDQLSEGVKACQQSIVRSEERLNLLSKRLEILEHVLTSGGEALMTRVALLEQTDKTIYGLREEDRKELKNLKTLSQIMSNFPGGLKGVVASVILLVITTTTVIDLFVKVNGVSDSLRHQLQLKE